MKTSEFVCGNLVYRELNQEEMERLEYQQTDPVPVPEPTQEERLESVEKRTTDLESGNAEILEALDMLLSGVTE